MKVLFFILVFSLILFIANENAIYAYQVDIECDKEGKLLEQKFSALNDLEKLIAAGEGEITDEISHALCQNTEDCLAHLGFISKLSSSTVDILDKYLENPKDIVATIKDKNESSLANKQKLKELNSQMEECSENAQGYFFEQSKWKQKIYQNKIEQEMLVDEITNYKQAQKTLNKFYKKLFNKKKREEIDNKISLAQERLNKLKEKNYEYESIFEEMNNLYIAEHEKVYQIKHQIKIKTNDTKELRAQLENDVSELKDFFAECDSDQFANKLTKGNYVSIYYPYNGRGNNKSSTQYDKESIQSLIDMSLTSGVDPYLTLAITMIENAPIRTEHNRSWMESNYYANSYGAIPVDAIAAYSIMGCIEQSANEEYDVKLVTPKRVKRIRIGTGSTKKRFCSHDKHVRLAASPNLYQADELDKGGCCIDVIGKSTSTSQEVKSYLGIQFLKNLQNRIDYDQDQHSAKGKYFALGYNAQRYNGLGTFGASEYMENHCILGIKMSERPVYGLLVQDLAMNSLMFNPAIRKMVENSSKRFNTKQTSVLCKSFGEGTSEIDSREFLKLQKEYLLNYEDDVSDWKKTKERLRKSACSKKGKVDFEPYEIEDIAEIIR
ncbi:MAG: hypothetical protein ACOCUH_00330 [Bacteriovoracia bacterium]